MKSLHRIITNVVDNIAQKSCLPEHILSEGKERIFQFMRLSYYRSEMQLSIAAASTLVLFVYNCRWREFWTSTSISLDFFSDAKTTITVSIEILSFRDPLAFLPVLLPTIIRFSCKPWTSTIILQPVSLQGHDYTLPVFVFFRIF